MVGKGVNSETPEQSICAYCHGPCDGGFCHNCGTAAPAASAAPASAELYYGGGPIDDLEVAMAGLMEMHVPLSDLAANTYKHVLGDRLRGYEVDPETVLGTSSEPTEMVSQALWFETASLCADCGMPWSGWASVMIASGPGRGWVEGEAIERLVEALARRFTTPELLGEQVKAALLQFGWLGAVACHVLELVPCAGGCRANRVKEDVSRET